MRINSRICGETSRQRRDSSASQAAVLHSGIGGGFSTRVIEILNGEEGRVKAHAGIRIGSSFAASVENAVTSTHYQLVCDPVSQSDPRRKIIKVWRNQPWAGIRSHWNNSGESRSQLGIYALWYDQGVCGQVECRLLIVPLLHCGENFITQTEIQCEAVSQFPVILRVEGINRAMIINIVQVIDAAAVAQSDQERSKTRAGVAR